MANEQQPRSILRNAPPPGTYEPLKSPEANGESEIDRSKVLQNTRANAKLHDEGARLMHEPSSSSSSSSPRAKGDLKWDEANIYKTEQEKSATMRIDEPKTPYQGPAGDSEYYLPDDEEDIVKTWDDKVLAVDELDEFSLGESQYNETRDSTIQNDRIQRDPEAVKAQEDEGEEEEEGKDNADLTAAERKRRFEEMRKAHYHMKGSVLHHPMPADDDEDEDE